MIRGGFGTQFDLEHGTSRRWYCGPDGVRRWLDTEEPVDGVAPQGFAVGDRVEVLPSEFNAMDALSGPARVVQVFEDNLDVEMLASNWSGIVHVNRIRRAAS